MQYLNIWKKWTFYY